MKDVAVDTRLQESLDADKDRVYIVSEHANGLDYFVNRYAFTPIKTQNRNWNIAANPAEGASTLPPAEWKQFLIEEGFTYVYVHAVNEAFLSDYGAMFREMEADDVAEHALYRIVPSDGLNILERVP